MYCFDKRPNGFMSTQIWKDAISTIITQREEFIISQNEVDSEYKSFCSLLMNEMDSFLDYKGSGFQTKKKFKFSKPFWNEELTDYWKNMREYEKEYIKCKGNKRQKTKKLCDFKFARSLFDKKLRYYERSYFRDKALEIEACDSSSPKAFWKHIKKPRTKENLSNPNKGPLPG